MKKRHRLGIPNSFEAACSVVCDHVPDGFGDPDAMCMRIGERVGLKFDSPLRVSFFDISNVTEPTDTLTISIFFREFYRSLLIRDIVAHI